MEARAASDRHLQPACCPGRCCRWGAAARGNILPQGIELTGNEGGLAGKIEVAHVHEAERAINAGKGLLECRTVERRATCRLGARDRDFEGDLSQLAGNVGRRFVGIVHLSSLRLRARGLSAERRVGTKQVNENFGDRGESLD